MKPATPTQYLTYFLEIAIENLMTDPKTSLSNIKKALALAKDLDPYLDHHAFLKNNPVLNALSKLTKQTDWESLYACHKTQKKLRSEMLTSTYEASLLSFFIQLIQAKRVLEIGMFTGYATLAMAYALPQEGLIITCEEEPYLIEFAKPFFEQSGCQKKIQVRLGLALDTLNDLIKEKQPFDMIFIDASKSECMDYYQLIKSGNLLSKSGLICVDNTLMKGLVYASKSKKNTLARSMLKFNQMIAEDPDVIQVILPVRDGLSVIRYGHPVGL